MASEWEDREPVGLDDRVQWAQAELGSIGGQLSMIDERAGEVVAALQDIAAEQRRHAGRVDLIAVLLVLVLATLWWKL